MERDPVFPPLLTSEPLAADRDPMAKAVAACAAGVDAGTIFWADREDVVSAAIALAPEAPLSDAMAMVPVAANGLSDALGALAPPEVAVTWDWPDGLRVNGARCGVLTAESDAREAAAPPHWLVIGLTVQLAPRVRTDGVEPGETPDLTALWEEGCINITQRDLLESWARHTLVWINRWLDDGFRPVHESWIGRVENVGEAVSFDFGGVHREGLFLGVDDAGAMLLKSGAATQAIPLQGMLDHPAAWPPRV
ncbi:MAG: biotin/lipoate--protein ligase family protein [Pseudomonadota bacterium]